MAAITGWSGSSPALIANHPFPSGRPSSFLRPRFCTLSPPLRFSRPFPVFSLPGSGLIVSVPKPPVNRRILRFPTTFLHSFRIHLFSCKIQFFPSKILSPPFFKKLPHFLLSPLSLLQRGGRPLARRRQRPQSGHKTGSRAGHIRALPLTQFPPSQRTVSRLRELLHSVR